MWSIWPGQVKDSSPTPASQAAEDTDVASSSPVPSALRRDGVGGDGHDHRELLLVLRACLVPYGGLVAVSDRTVLDGPVGRRTDLHQPARPRERLVEAVPREGRQQVAVDRAPGGGDLLSTLRGRRLRDCPTRRLHVPGRLLALVGPERPAPLRAYSSASAQQLGSIATPLRAAGKPPGAWGAQAAGSGRAGGLTEYETRHVRDVPGG